MDFDGDRYASVTDCSLLVTGVATLDGGPIIHGVDIMVKDNMTLAWKHGSRDSGSLSGSSLTVADYSSASRKYFVRENILVVEIN